MRHAAFSSNHKKLKRNMKYTSTRRNFIRSIVAGLCLLPIVSKAANIVVGTGNDRSYLVLESGNLGVRTYEIRYDASSGPHDAKFLIDQAMAGDNTLTAIFFNYGDTNNPNYFIDSINGESGSASPPWTWWKQWVSGGSGFENPDYTFNPGTPTPGAWTSGYGISSPNRLITPGSWDALVLSDGSVMPSVAPIPETSSLLLAPLAALVVLRRRRNG